MVRSRRRWALLAAAVFFCAGAAPPTKVVARIDLSKPFHLPPGASFIATQGSDVEDPAYGPPGMVPGRIRLCLRSHPSSPCAPNVEHAWDMGGIVDDYSEIHFLDQAEIIYPRGRKATPLLLLRTGSFHSVDGDQIRSVQLIAYRPREKRFAVVLREQSGGNRNEEIRYVESGPLTGAIISNNPTDDAPFAYWIKVYRPSLSGEYPRVLRYRSATRYGDGNPLAVIDSEMPNILKRLGLWKPGQPLPLPDGRCPRPRLVKSELWCS